MHTVFFLLLTALPAQPHGHCVLDEAEALPADTFAALENSCEAMDRSGDGQYEIIVTDDFRDAEISEFANETFHAWGIGHKGKDDGILIVLSPKLRKWRIEVGYGLEGRVTDAQAAAIGRELGVPFWKSGAWGAGLIAVVNALTPLMHVEAKVRPPTPERSPDAVLAVLGCAVTAVILMWLLILWLSRDTRRRARERERQLELDELRNRRERFQNVPSAAPRATYERQVTPIRPVVTHVVHEETRRRDDTPTRNTSSDSFDSSPSSSNDTDSGGFSGGGGGDAGGGGAGGDF